MNNLRRFYWGQSQIDFVGRYVLWFTVSGILLGVSVLGLALRGLNLSIDFAGGTTWSVQAADFGKDQASQVADRFGLTDPTIQEATTLQGEPVVRLESRAVEPETADQVTNALAEAAGIEATQVNTQSVGATWGRQVSQQALYGLIVFLVIVVLYITVRFEFKMAITALAEMSHDLIIVLGVYAIGQFPVSPATIIGTLTMLGYSLYDAVVVFDKVHENGPLLATGRMGYGELVNLSMNQTLARSFGTSFTSILPAASLLFVGSLLLGAVVLQDLALALFVGIASGTYSSIFFASPILAKWKEREPRYRDQEKKAQGRAERQAKAAAAAAGTKAASTATAATDSGDGESAEPKPAKVAAGADKSSKKARPHGRPTPVAKKRRR